MVVFFRRRLTLVVSFILGSRVCNQLAITPVADTEIEWRQDAVDAEIATADESVALIAWRKYRVLLMRVDTSKPVWPALPGEQFS